MVDGIQYEPIPGLHWEMRRLEPEASEEMERYAARLYKVQNADKTLYDHVEIESEVERRFAKGLDDNNNVKFFMKLPAWFTVDTPIGPYNPDWAIVFEDRTACTSSARRRDPRTPKSCGDGKRPRSGVRGNTSTRSASTTR